MASEIGKKRQRSESPTSKQRQLDVKTVLSPPEKRRRSSITDQTLPITQPRGQGVPSPSRHKLPEVSATSSIPASKKPQNTKSAVKNYTNETTRQQDGHRSSGNVESPHSGDSRRAALDRNQLHDRNIRRDGDRGHRRRSPPRQRNGDRYTPTPRRSRTRSPNRNKSPINNRSAYGRRDPPPPRRRSRSPSPIRRSPPAEEQPSRRPGGGTGRGRNVLAIAERLAQEREREEAAKNPQQNRDRGVQHLSNEFYNSRPNWVEEKGRDWRKKESKIKGLRSFNNWIKSCVIQKFSPEEAPQVEELGWGEEPKAPTERKPLLVLDMGCGKGGDLGKWQLASQSVGLYVGLDPADQSINQARTRYSQMRRGRKPIFDARFHVKDCFGEWLGDIPIVKEVGIDPNAGHGGPSKWSGGGFDVVTMMFSMHYAFESEQKARMMLRNVSGALKKGGRFIGVVPNSDAIAAQVVKWCKANQDQEKKTTKPAGAASPPTTSSNGEAAAATHDDANPAAADDVDPTATDNESPTWGNSIYNVRFGTDRPIPSDGIFRDPPFGWKYMYWMEEAVDVPEYVVPWEAFRAVAEGFNLEQRYRKPFLDIWEAEKGDRELSELSVRMGVPGGGGRDGRGGGELGISAEEREAVAFYHAFCFVKV